MNKDNLVNKDNRDYWNQFYSKPHKTTPSQFCAYVMTELEEGNTVLELGSGNGRDSLFMAYRGVNVVALDLSTEAISNCEAEAKEHAIDSVSFQHCDLSNRDHFARVTELAREKSLGKPLTFYSRFVMHSINEAQEQVFMENLGEFSRVGEKIYFEFRSKEDEALEKHFGNHYRRYIDTDQFVDNLSSIAGFDTEYVITGRGMAKYKEEDPFITRIIAVRACSVE